MRIFVSLLCAVCAARVRGVFDGSCPRKDPPPGALVLTSGSSLSLTCRGHVTVDGVKVDVKVDDTRNGSDAARRRRSAAAPTTGGQEVTDAHGVTRGRHRDDGAEVTSPGEETMTTAHAGRPATPTADRTTRAESHSEEEEEEEEDYDEDEEEEGEAGTRVTRGVKSRPQWTWNGRRVTSGKRHWGEVTFDRKGAAMTLPSLGVEDSGKFACHHRGEETFSVRVIINDPPERPNLSCYKKSPTSKIRCDWTPQSPVSKHLSCYLVVFKRSSSSGFSVDNYVQARCSYSSRLGRFWCVLDHNDNEVRDVHKAYLCATSLSGNVTSELLTFIPMDIVRPDPPADITVSQVEGQQKELKVKWGPPTSWRHQDRFYEKIYQLRYRPLDAGAAHEQVAEVEKGHSYTIRDLISGVHYLIQLRTKEEFEGEWGDWSSPVITCSWTPPEPREEFPTEFSGPQVEGSGTYGEHPKAEPEPVEGRDEASHHFLWVSGSFVLLSVVLAAYMFRYKDRLLSKLHCVNDSSQRPPVAAGQRPPLTFTRPLVKGPSPTNDAGEEEEEEEENEEGQSVTERTEAGQHFNNTSYFLIQRE